jgi:GNAT superfamily N-acetyltransferase
VSETRVVELSIPSVPDGVGWAELSAAVDVANRVRRDQLGTAEFDATPRQAWAVLADQEHAIRRQLLAYAADQLVGIADLELDRGHTTAWVSVAVVPEHRSRGVGRQLAEAIVEVARSEGATILQSGSETTDLDSRPRLTAPTGYGDIPAGAPSTRLLQHLGFSLAQVELMSALDLPVPEERLTELSTEVRAADDYDLVSWQGRVPDDLVDDYARLRMIMSTAAPAGELIEEEQPWDADRVRRREQRHADAGNVIIDTAARHRESGRLVAFTSISFAAAADGRAVSQGYTLVEPEHRGHNLGIRIKINNLRLLAEHDHGARRVVTGNAGENDAMLSINRALGFRPAYVAGWWQRRLS